MFFGLFRLVKCFADWNFSRWVHFWDPQPPRGWWFFTRNRYLYRNIFYQVDFWGTRGSQPDALRDHLGPFLASNRPQKSIFGDFHDHVVKVWVQGALGRFSELSPESRFRFFRVGGGPGASRAVAGLQRGEVDKHQKHPW